MQNQGGRGQEQQEHTSKENKNVEKSCPVSLAVNGDLIFQ